MEYLRLFEQHSQYTAYTASTEIETPHVSYCRTQDEVHYDPKPPIVVVAKFGVTGTSNPTRIASGTSSFSKIEIDGVVQPSVSTSYTFSTTGEHTVKYYLKSTTIGDRTFYQCTGLTSIDIPDSVTSIGNDAFNQCTSLTSIDIPSGVTRIGNYTFAYCYSLTSCTIGSGVTSIGEYAFYECTSLTSIVCNATTAPTIVRNTFQYIKTGGTLTVPIGSSGYNVWMGTSNYYLGSCGWTKVEQ